MGPKRRRVVGILFVDVASKSELTAAGGNQALVGLSTLHLRACQLELFGAEKIGSGKTGEETRNRW